MLYVIIFTIIFLALILGFYTFLFNNFQSLIIKINEAEININGTLNKKFDLLNRSIGVIKGNVKIDKEIFENIVKLRSRKIDDFELDKELETTEIEFNIIKDEYESLNEVDNFNKICDTLKDVKEQLIATKLYYNDCAVKYNKLVRYFPSNILAIIFKYKEKPFYQNIEVYMNNK